MKAPMFLSNLPRWMPGLLLLAALLWLMRDTAVAMVEIWSRSETFTHAFLVPPIALWLAWRQRAVLAATPTRPVPWLLLPMAVVSFGWLLGHLAAVGVVTQFALLTLIVLSVPAVFGWAVARVVAFPLAFLYFAVPFGEFTQPVLMDWTADFTVMALRATGVPVYREGLNFVIPSGQWSVVEACSGSRYLIASLMVGTLFAYLNYRSLRRRLLFMAVAIVVPLVANWLRAYMIVMIGHLSGNQLAVGVDHLIYGWVFFGIVIGLMFFIGARWSEPEQDDAIGPVAATASSRGGWGMAVGVAAVVGVTQVWAWQLDHAEAASAPVVTLPPVTAPWAASQDPLPWTPLYVNPSATALGAYRHGDRPIWLWVAYFRDTSDERKLISSVNRLSGSPKDGWVIRSEQVVPATDVLPAGNAMTLQRRNLLAAGATERTRVWQTYWVGHRWTASPVQAKIWQAVDRLLGRHDDGAVIVLATPESDDADGTLAEFARLHFPAIDATLRQARDTR
jgi:exosortase A